MNISFDFDDTLTTKKGQQVAKYRDGLGDKLWIISARNEVSKSMIDLGKEFGIPVSRILATGSNKAKVEAIQANKIDAHYDNNPDVISEVKALDIKAHLI
jgi:hypothetical protein